MIGCKSAISIGKKYCNCEILGRQCQFENVTFRSDGIDLCYLAETELKIGKNLRKRYIIEVEI